MTEEKRGAAAVQPAEAKRASTTASTPTTGQQLLRQSQDAYGEFTAALAEAWQENDPGDRARAAYFEYLNQAAAEWAPARVAERNADAARSYSRAVEAFADPEQDSAAAYRNYIVEVTERLPAETDARVRDAYQKYLDTCAEALAPADFERRTTSAWADYVSKLKDAWSELDTAAEPATVAALAQSALAAAAASQSAQDVVKQRESARENLTSVRPT